MKKNLFTLLFLIASSGLYAQPPQDAPPVEVIARGEIRDSLVSELITLCDYKGFFDSIRDMRLEVLSKEFNWNSEKVSKIQEKVKFSDLDMHYFYSGYSKYSTEELREILGYFQSMSDEELSNTMIKYETIILRNIGIADGTNMDGKIKRAVAQL